MKNLKTALIVLIVSFFVNAVNAQTVILDKKTSRTEDNTSITIKFDVDQIASTSQADTYRSKMAAAVAEKGKVNVQPMKAGKSTYSITFRRKEFSVQRLQNILIAAGLNDVIVDGEKMKTADMATKFAPKKGEAK